MFDEIKRVLINYNSSEHDTIRSIPERVFTGKDYFNNERLVQDKSEKPEVFEVGDRVRVLLKRKLLEKIESRYSKEVYTVSKKNEKSYRIVDKNGDDYGRAVKAD